VQLQNLANSGPFPLVPQHAVANGENYECQVNGTYGQLSLRLEVTIPTPACECKSARPANFTNLTANCTRCGVETEVDISGLCEPCGQPSEEVYGS